MTIKTNVVRDTLGTATGEAVPDIQVQIARIDDALSSIKTQISTAELARQHGQKAIDPNWFHRAKTALRHLRRERAELLASKPASKRKAAFKDTLIAVLRERFDAKIWQSIIDEAKARFEQEARHG